MKWRRHMYALQLNMKMAVSLQLLVRIQKKWVRWQPARLKNWSNLWGMIMLLYTALSTKTLLTSAYPMMTMSTCEEKKIETLDVCFPAMKGEVHFAAKSHGAKPIMVGRRDRWPRCLREATMRGKDLKHVRAKVIRFACNCIPYFLDRGRIFTIM